MENIILLRTLNEFIKAYNVYNEPTLYNMYSFQSKNKDKSSDDFVAEFIKNRPINDVLYYKTLWYKHPTIRKAIVYGQHSRFILYKNIYVAYQNNLDKGWYSSFSKYGAFEFNPDALITVSDQKDKIKEFNIVL